jgi:uncharacterized membrane protein
VIRPLSLAGVLAAAAGCAVSVVPSLVPRSAVIQGLLMGCLAAFAYGLGAVVGWSARSLRHQPRRRASSRTWIVSAAVCSALVVSAAGIGHRWQSELAAVSGVDPPSWTWIPVSLSVGVAVAALLLTLARGLRRLTRLLARWFGRMSSPRAATVGASTVMVVLAGVALYRLPTALVDALSPLFRAANASTPAGVQPPSSPVVSGGPDSAIPWSQLGSQGRAFVSGVTATGELSAFSGTPAQDPIRVFVGVETATTPAERADLAVAELDRFGAFEREVIAIGTSAGSGTVDPGEVVPLEYLTNGDVATVSTQYSILPSFLSFLVDRPNSVQESRAVLEAVRERVDAMPPSARPRVVVFGESLGAYGASGAFTDLTDVLRRTDGAMFQGPPNATGLWRRYTAAREPGTPERLPVFDDGRHLRWANQPTDLAQPADPFDAPRVVYLQNASDPVVWWSPALLWDRPDWLAEPRGPGVLDWPWLPVVTFAGLTGDMMNSQGVPPGHGHVYGTDPVVAWADILRPAGWAAQETARLQEHLGG